MINSYRQLIIEWKEFIDSLQNINIISFQKFKIIFF